MDVFVGNIPLKYKESDVRGIFDGLGTISAVKLNISNITRLNKGFCFVTFPNAQEGQKAIETINGKEVEGKKLEVLKVEGSTAEWEKKMLRHGSSKPGGSSQNFGKGGKIKSGSSPKSFGGGPRGVMNKTGGSRGS